MKRKLALLLLLVMLLALCSCGSGNTSADNAGDAPAPEIESTAAPEVEMEAEAEPTPTATPLSLGDQIVTDNFVMTFESMDILSEYSYRTGDYSSTSLYVEDGYKLLLVRGHFENTGTTAIQASAFTRSAKVNDSFEVDGYDAHFRFQRSKDTEIDPYTDQDYCLYINLPQKLAEQFETASFTIGFNDDMSPTTTVWNSDGTKTVEADNFYVLTSGVGQAAPAGEDSAAAAANANQPIAVGDTIVTDDYEFTLKKVELSYEILPQNTSSVYTSYPADSGKVYIHVAADVKNTMQRDIRINELYTASALYDGKYPYEGFTIVDDGNRFDWVGSYVAATPLATCGTHSLIECPAEVDTSGKSILVTIDLGGTTYEYTLR